MKQDNIFTRPVQQILPMGTEVKKANTMCQAKVRHVSKSVYINRIIAALISTIHKDDTEFKQSYTIDVKSLVEEQPNINYWSYIKKTCKDLVQSGIELEDEEENRLKYYNYFQSIEYYSGMITARFSDELQPYLLQLRKEFTKYKLIEYLRLSTPYSQKLFEYVKSWSGAERHEIKIEKLHDILGVPESYRKNFKNFRIFILEKAYKEIIEKTELRFEMFPIKVGGAKSKTGKVTHIVFIIKNEKNKIQESEHTKTNDKHFTNEIQSTVEETSINNQPEPQPPAPVKYQEEEEPLEAPPLAQIWQVMEPLLREKIGEKNLATWFEPGIEFGKDEKWRYVGDYFSHYFYPVILEENYLYLDFNNQSDSIYVLNHFGKAIQESFDGAVDFLMNKTGMCNIQGFKITYLKVRELREQQLFNIKKEKEKEKENKYNRHAELLEKQPLEIQFEELLMLYPKHRRDVSDAFRVFVALKKEREKKLKNFSPEELNGTLIIPTTGELVKLLKQFTRSEEWLKENGKYVKTMSRWLRSKPWATTVRLELKDR